MAITIEGLPSTAIPSRDHVLPAMKDGLSVKLTVGQILDILIGSAPGTLDTIEEIAAALQDNPDFYETLTNLIGEKASTTDVNAALATKITASGGAILKSAYSEYTGATGITATIPVDDTIPQIGEGTEIISASFTPLKATSKLRITASVGGGMSALGNVTAALFVNGGANAVRARDSGTSGAGYDTNIHFIYEYSPGSVTSQTIAIRVGVNTGTFYPNGSGGTGPGRRLGGAQACSMVIEEIAG